METSVWPEVLPVGYVKGETFLQSPAGRLVTAIISIHGRDELAVVAPGIPRLDLTFVGPMTSNPSSITEDFQAQAIREFREKNGTSERGPNLEDARAIVTFAQTIRARDGVVLCQSGDGVSRGPAAAILCLATWRGVGKESECVEEVLRVQPTAVPLPELVKLGDDVLGRGGRLIEALVKFMRDSTGEESPGNDKENDPVAQASDQHEGPVLCPHCGIGNIVGQHFCWRCRTPLTNLSVTDPVRQIYSQFDTFQKASQNPQYPIVVIGMCLIWGPSAIGFTLLPIYMLQWPFVEPFHSIAEIFMFTFLLLFFGILAVISDMLLYRTLRNYFRQRGQPDD